MKIQELMSQVRKSRDASNGNGTAHRPIALGHGKVLRSRGPSNIARRADQKELLH